MVLEKVVWKREEYLEIGLLEDHLPGPAGLQERSWAGFRFVATVGDSQEKKYLGIGTKMYYTVLPLKPAVIGSSCSTPEKNLRYDGSSSPDSGIEASPSAPLPDILRDENPIIMLPHDAGNVEVQAQSVLGFYKSVRKKKIAKIFDIWVHVPMHGFQPLLGDSGPECMRSVADPEEATRAYFWWHKVLEATGFTRHCSVALELDQYFDSAVSYRWLSETIGCIVIPTSVMLDLSDNNKDPTLSRDHLRFVNRAVELHGCRLMLYDDVGSWEDGRASACLRRLRAISRYYPGYVRDDYHVHHLPCQPLSHNLHDGTYQSFEEDSVKYQKYQTAIENAFRGIRRKRQLAPTPNSTPSRFGPEGKSKDPFKVGVLGCGRGPLISRVLAAAESVGATVKVYGVEKNPVTRDILHKKLTDEWKDQNVELVFGDMRTWEPDEKLDMIVSELIGNFADDELSPECLEVPQKILKEDGISIPGSYSSFIQPISSTVLYVELQRWYKKKGGLEQMHSFGKDFVKVVRFAKEKKLFSFSHPDFSSVISNERHSIVEFMAEKDGVLHGFAGYFTIVLHGLLDLSTVAGKATPGLFSWAPAFFPLVELVFVTKGDPIKVEFWRRCDETSVWYEWQLQEPKQTIVHNLNGKYFKFHKVFQDFVDV